MWWEKDGLIRHEGGALNDDGDLLILMFDKTGELFESRNWKNWRRKGRNMAVKAVNSPTEQDIWRYGS